MEQREELLEATMIEFNKNGYRFTMDDISKRMGISKKTLYQLVENKESLFFEAIDDCFGSIKQSELAIYSDETLSLIEKLRNMIIVLPKKYQALDFSKLYELQAEFPKTFEKIESRIETDWGLTISLIESCIEAKLIRNISIPILQSMISASIEYFISHKVLNENGISYKNALEQMMDILLEGIMIND